VVAEAPDRVDEVLLLVGERKVHRARSLTSGPQAPPQARNETRTRDPFLTMSGPAIEYLKVAP
jgi:hypothetical protein